MDAPDLKESSPGLSSAYVPATTGSEWQGASVVSLGFAALGVAMKGEACRRQKQVWR